MKQRNIRVRAIRRDPPDLKLLAKALIELQLDLQKQQAEQEAKARRRSSK